MREIAHDIRIELLRDNWASAKHLSIQMTFMLRPELSRPQNAIKSSPAISHGICVEHIPDVEV